MDLIIKAIAVWRISHMLVHEKGPGNLLLEIREYIDRVLVRQYNKSILLNPLHCVWCTSLWIAPIFSILGTKWATPWVLSALAILIDEIYQWHELLFNEYEAGHEYED